MADNVTQGTGSGEGGHLSPTRCQDDQLLILPGRADIAGFIDSLVDYAVFLLDGNGRAVTWNPGAERLTGRRAEQMEGRDLGTLYVPEEVLLGQPGRDLRTAEREGRCVREGWWSRADGSAVWVRWVIRVLPAAVAGPHFGVIATDMTDSKSREHALRSSEAALALMVSSVVDYAIFMLDVEGNVLSWNEGAHRLKQYDTDEIIGTHFSIFYPAEDRAAGKPQRLLQEAVSAGRVEDEGWRVRKDGSRFWADVVITALRLPDGTLRGFAKVTRDVTERKQAEDELRAAVERERQALAQVHAVERGKEDLVAIVAHDLRAPVGVLHGTAEKLASDWNSLDDAARLELLELICSTSSQLNALIDDVLDTKALDA